MVWISLQPHFPLSFFLFYVYECFPVHALMPAEFTRGLSNPLELEFQMAVSTTWVLGTEAAPLRGQPVLSITEPSSQALLFSLPLYFIRSLSLYTHGCRAIY